MPRTFSTPPQVSEPEVHHGTCVTHVPWCMSGLLTSGFLWNRCRGNCSRHSRRKRNPQLYVSGKRPIANPCIRSKQLKVCTQNSTINIGPLSIFVDNGAMGILQFLQVSNVASKGGGETGVLSPHPAKEDIWQKRQCLIIVILNIKLHITRFPFTTLLYCGSILKGGLAILCPARPGSDPRMFVCFNLGTETGCTGFNLYLACDNSWNAGNRGTKYTNLFKDNTACSPDGHY